MRALISRSKINGTVAVPSSKSYTIRGLMCGALARGTTRLLSPLGSDDTVAAARVLKQLGVKIRQFQNAWSITSDGFKAPAGDLYCGDSAATLRFLTALCALAPGECRLMAGPSLSRRPVQPLVDALGQLGVVCSSCGGLPPVTVKGGVLKGGRVTLPGDVSRQFVSALLMAAALSAQGIEIKLTSPLESRPYVMMTLDTMQWFGITVAFNDALDEFEVLPQKYHPTGYRIEGDWSSASYLLALGALGGAVTVDNLPAATMQGDRVILDILRQMGADMTVRQSSVTVRKSVLTAVKTDLTDSTDLLPTVAILAAAAKGKSEINGIARARLKESDRVAAVCDNLTRMGINTKMETNRLIVQGGSPHGAVVESYNDHRIAMAFGVLGARVGETGIKGAECVSKTYPEFWDVFRLLGGKVVNNEQ